MQGVRQKSYQRNYHHGWKESRPKAEVRPVPAGRLDKPGSDRYIRDTPAPTTVYTTVQKVRVWLWRRSTGSRSGMSRHTPGSRSKVYPMSSTTAPTSRKI